MTREEHIEEARKTLENEESDIIKLNNHIIWLKGYIAGLKFEEGDDADDTAVDTTSGSAGTDGEDFPRAVAG